MNIPTTMIKSKGRLQGDMAVWMILFLLCAISLIEVYSASSNMSYKSGQYWRPVVEHGFYIILGLIVTFGAHLVSCKMYKLVSVCLAVVSIGLLIYTLISGAQVNDAGRWITIAGRTIQPSEFAKISTVGTVALFMATMRDSAGFISSNGIKWIGVLTAIMCGLIASENFSTAGLLFIIVLLMLWIGRARTKVLLCIIVPLMTLAIGSYTVAKSMSKETATSIAETVPALHRLPTWVGRLQKGHDLPEDPKDYDVASNQQVAHAQIAIATSNVVGRGPGKSIERDYLPQAFSDFIFAIIIEEGGIESATLVLLLYLFLLYRAYKIAGKCATRFPAYLVMGLSLMLVVQAMINMGVAVGLLPVTGQPLPLVSKGGTSTIITCFYIGMILSVSRSARQIEEVRTALTPVNNENNTTAGTMPEE